MTSTLFYPLIAAALLLIAPVWAASETIFISGSKVTFAALPAARSLLTNRDDFIQVMSPFDRSARMKVAAFPTEPQFLAFLGTNALAWTFAETDRMASLLGNVAKLLSKWPLSLPSEISLVKTTGQEEGNAAYTRGSAIILPQDLVNTANEDLLVHELFHVMSRHDPALRTKLYQIIGFVPINEVQLPVALRPIKVTNPDGAHNNFMVRVEHGGKTLPVVPVLLSSATVYDPVKGGEFFEYLVLKLLVLQNEGAAYAPRLDGAKAALLSPAAVPSYFDQVGRNTDYIIHPDEILASNFVDLVHHRTNLATPRITAQMDGVLLAHRPSLKAR